MPQGKRRIFFGGEKIGFNKIMRFGCAFYHAKILGFFVLRYEVCIRRIFYSCETLVREKCVIFSNALFQK